MDRLQAFDARINTITARLFGNMTDRSQCQIDEAAIRAKIDEGDSDLEDLQKEIEDSTPKPQKSYWNDADLV